MSILLTEYEDVCNAYVNKFSKKHDLEFDGWVADHVGEIAIFATQYYFSVNDIIFDIENKLPKYLTLEWQDHVVELGMADKPSINLRSYIMLNTKHKITYHALSPKNKED